MRKKLILSALPVTIVVILGIAFRVAWWKVLIAAVVVDFATDILIITETRRRMRRSE